MSAAPASVSRRICIESIARLRTSGRGAALWHGDQLALPALPSCPSGYVELDSQLPGGGWPTGGLTELLLPQAGSGEIQLLAPALRRLATRELVWVAPPHPPYAPALAALGLPIERLIWVRLTEDEANTAWAAEQVLRSGAAGAVLWWSRSALPTTLRRLHWAAQEGNTPLFAFRPSECRQQSSPAPLRLAIEPAPDAGLRVHLLKRRGPSLAQPLLLSLPHPAHEGRLAPSASLPIVIPTSAVEDVVAGTSPALAAA